MNSWKCQFSVTWAFPYVSPKDNKLRYFNVITEGTRILDIFRKFKKKCTLLRDFETFYTKINFAFYFQFPQTFWSLSYKSDSSAHTVLILDNFRFRNPCLAVATHPCTFCYGFPISSCFLPLGQAVAVTFTIVQPPRHGTLERILSGQHPHLASTFTMEDIYQKRVSYSHDGSNSIQDRFSFTVSDGTNPFFIIKEGGREVRGLAMVCNL